MRVVSAAPPAVRAAVGTHPLGVQPIGNALLDDGPPRRPVELGAFRVFDDEFLLQLLTEYVDAKSVARLGATSRTFYALASAPQIWRDHYTADIGPKVERWAGSWRGTYAAACRFTGETAAVCSVSAKGVYSDVVYHAFLTAAFDPRDFLEYHTGRENARIAARRKGDAVERPAIADNMSRIKASDGIDMFLDEYARQGQPCIITGAMDDWPCRNWTLDEIVRRWPTRVFQAEAIRIDASTYAEYARSAGGGGAAGQRGFVPDTSPFYLFDADLASGEPDASREWRVPELLSCVPGGDGTSASTRADLFSLFGELRPDYRWLIAGPARSGSGVRIY